MKQTLTLTLCSLLTATIVFADDARLGAERWREFGYGVSLLPPKGATVIDAPPGDALVAFVDADGTQISLTIREAVNVMDINGLKARAAQQLTIPFPSWVPMDDPDPLDELAGFPAGRVYMAIPDKAKGDWVMGHVFVLLDDFLFINLQMQTSAAAFHDAHRTFDAVARSIELMDPADLDALRTLQLETGQAWLKSVTREQLLAATPPSQLFRILVAGKDVGYMKITHEPAEQLGIKGRRVTQQAHTDGDGDSTDVASEFFEAEDGRSEVWLTHLTRRNDRAPSLPTPAMMGDQSVNLRETGTRDDRGIEVITETRSRIETHRWATPQIAFLSQFKKMLMGPLLPRQRTTLAFYAYSPEVKKLSLMTLRIEPIVQGPQRGGYAVLMRPAPGTREQTFIYDAQGALFEWLPGDGRTFRATTPAELEKVWAGRK